MYESDDKIKFEIVTPERVVLKVMIKKVTVPTQEGELTILPKHMPLVGILVPGVIELTTEADEVNIISVAGGFIEVVRNKVVVLADTAERAEELDEQRIISAKQKAEKEVKEVRHEDMERYASISTQLAKELARTKAVSRWKKLKNYHYENKN